MLSILGRSRVALNRHVAIAGDYANNMRLFEATGMGACLLTDNKRNLRELFAVGMEVVAYDDPSDACEKARYLLEHDSEAAKMADAGRLRTLRDHTYEVRMPQLLTLIDGIKARPISEPHPHHWHAPTEPFVARAKSRLAASAVGPALLRARDRMRGTGANNASTDYVVVTNDEGLDPELASAWKDERIPSKQRAVVDADLRKMYAGTPPVIFDVAAQALRATSLSEPSVLEVGCASGYYSEVFRYLVTPKIRYVGADYSMPLVSKARDYYPATPFVVSDGARLPFADNAFDVVVSGCVLLHMPEYAAAISEAFRTARSHVIFHRTPVVRDGATTWMRKKAYGVDVVELVFGESELMALFDKAGADVVRRWTVGSHDLPGVPEHVEIATYLCRARGIDWDGLGIQS
jgi:SAM-dependent methyltransferase